MCKYTCDKASKLVNSELDQPRTPLDKAVWQLKWIVPVFKSFHEVLCTNVHFSTAYTYYLGSFYASNMSCCTLRLPSYSTQRTLTTLHGTSTMCAATFLCVGAFEPPLSGLVSWTTVRMELLFFLNKEKFAKRGATEIVHSSRFARPNSSFNYLS